MTTFEQALRGRLKKLDDDYARHRNALLVAIECEHGAATNGGVSPKPIAPPRPLHMVGLTENEVQSQKAFVMAAITKLAIEGKMEFSKSDVISKLTDGVWAAKISTHTIKNIASFLWRLHRDDKFIEVKEKGQGHRQSVYAIAKKE